MKKYFALILAILTVLSSLAVFASCGGSEKATGTASATETVTETDTDTETATNTETETVTDQDTESNTETETETETVTETETEAKPIVPEEELETMLSHLWYEYDFTAEGGLDEIKRIDLEAEGLNCATLDGWTKISVLYIPEKKTGNKKWSFSDYLSPFGGMRSIQGGDFSFGVRFNPAMKVFASGNEAVYPAANVEYVQVTEDYFGAYTMFVETFVTSQVTAYVNGTPYITMHQPAEKTGQRGELTTSHSVLFLNAYTPFGAADDSVVDLYKQYGVKTMYTAAYAYAVSAETVQLLNTYFDAQVGKPVGLPEVEVLPLSFVNPETTLSFKEDLTASNYDTVIAYPYWSKSYTDVGGLKGTEIVDLRALWNSVKKTRDRGNGAALEGISFSALFYIPDTRSYTDQDYLALLEYNDYDANGWMGSCLRYNLGTGIVTGINALFDGTNSVARVKKVTGWALFVYSYDGDIVKLWLNDELIFVGDISGELNCDYSINHAEHLHDMVVNGWVTDQTSYYPNNTIANSLVDMYEAYGIYLMKAEMYAYPANEQAAHHFYELADIPE